MDNVQTVVNHLVNVGARQRGLNFDEANILFEFEYKDDFASCDESTYLSRALEFVGSTRVDVVLMNKILYDNADKLSDEIRKLLYGEI